MVREIKRLLSFLESQHECIRNGIQNSPAERISQTLTYCVDTRERVFFFLFIFVIWKNFCLVATKFGASQFLLRLHFFLSLIICCLPFFSHFLLRLFNYSWLANKFCEVTVETLFGSARVRETLPCECCCCWQQPRQESVFFLVKRFGCLKVLALNFFFQK